MTASVQAQNVGDGHSDVAPAGDEHERRSEEGLPAHAALRRARRFWWWVLGVSAAVSVLGNALDAWIRVAQARPELIHPRPNLTVVLLPPVVAAGLAALVPIALLVHTHGLALLVQAPSKFGWLSRLIVLAVILLLGAGGFVLSFEALTELAMQAGYDSKLAWLFPVLVDGSIAGATIALLSLPQQVSEPAPNHPVQRPHLITAPPVEQGIVGPEPVESSAVVVQLPLHKCEEPAQIGERDRSAQSEGSEGTDHPVPSAPPESPQPASELDPDGSAQDWALVAQRLCDGTYRDPDQVAAILHMAFDKNFDPTQIAAKSGMRDRAVVRLLDDARPYRLIAAATG